MPFLALVLKQKATLAAPALLQVRTTILLLFFSLYEAYGHFKLANHRPVSIFCAASKVLQNFNYVFWLSHQDQYHYWRSKQFLHIVPEQPFIQLTRGVVLFVQVQRSTCTHVHACMCAIRHERCLSLFLSLSNK